MTQEFRIEIPQIDPRWSRSLVPLAAIVIAGLALLSSSVYSVGAESVGVIQRFGKYTGTVDPGLRFKLKTLWVKQLREHFKRIDQSWAWSIK